MQQNHVKPSRLQSPRAGRIKAKAIGHEHAAQAKSVDFSYHSLQIRMQHRFAARQRKGLKTAQRNQRPKLVFDLRKRLQPQAGVCIITALARSVATAQQIQNCMRHHLPRPIQPNAPLRIDHHAVLLSAGEAQKRAQALLNP